MKLCNLGHIGTTSLFALLSSICSFSYAQGQFDVLYIKAGQICLQVQSKPPNCLPGDGRAKSLPVWSHDGRRIAYIEPVGTPSALARLVVIDRTGTKLAAVPLKPIGAGEVRSGMRKVESLEWISEKLIVVSGSINPSSFEALVVDATQNAVISEIVSDSFAPTFSSKGASYVALTGQPHFTPAYSKRPRIIVDGTVIPDLVPPQMEVADAPSWAPDGNALAIPLRHLSASTSVLTTAVIWVRDSNAKRTVELPSNTVRLEWGRLGIVASTSTQGRQPGAADRWELPIVTKPFQLLGWRVPAVGSSSDTQQTMRDKISALRSTLRLENGADVDIWCSSCELSSSRRIVPKK